MKNLHLICLVFVISYTAFLYADRTHDYGVNPRRIDPSKDKEYKIYRNGPRNTMGLGYVRPPGETDQQTEERLLKEAKKGNTSSQVELGCFYFYEVEPEQYQNAYKWFTIAADKGLDIAQYYVGLCYENGLGVQQNDKEAFQSYMTAAKQNNADAECKVGTCYQRGIGIKQNMEIAVYWWSISASKGNTDAQGMLGISYLNGYGVTQDYSMAIKYLNKASEKNNAIAQNNLGNCFFYGKGVPTNVEKAYFWWIISYQNDCAEAFDNRNMAEKELIDSQIIKVKAEAQNWLFRHSEDN
jgi:uncharacterized protein